MNQESLEKYVIETNGVFEGGFKCVLNGRKTLWKERSNILRSTERDALLDAEAMLDGYLSVNII